MLKSWVSLVVLLCFSYCVSAQTKTNAEGYIEYYGGRLYLPDGPFELKDSLTGTRYVLDSAHIHVTAIDTSGNILWHTNPRIDAKLEDYRVRTERSKSIVYIAFHNDEWTDFKTVISVSFGNTQFGYLDRETGKFRFVGQD